MSGVWRKTAFPAALAVLTIVLAGAMGAGPNPQEEVPPRPFFPEHFSGHVSLPDADGAQLVACVDDCRETFESAPVTVASGGSYSMLTVDPEDKGVLGHVITFYLVNRWGRIRAVETVNYDGLFGICGGQVGACRTLDLSFADPVPAPTPTPTSTPIPTVTPTASLPVPGDPGVTAIPKLALAVGAAAAAAGILLLLLVRRRVQ